MSQEFRFLGSVRFFQTTRKCFIFICCKCSIKCAVHFWFHLSSSVSEGFFFPGEKSPHNGRINTSGLHSRIENLQHCVLSLLCAGPNVIQSNKTEPTWRSHSNNAFSSTFSRLKITDQPILKIHLTHCCHFAKDQQILRNKHKWSSFSDPKLSLLLFFFFLHASLLSELSKQAAPWAIQKHPANHQPRQQTARVWFGHNKLQMEQKLWPPRLSAVVPLRTVVLVSCFGFFSCFCLKIKSCLVSSAGLFWWKPGLVGEGDTEPTTWLKASHLIGR